MSIPLADALPQIDPQANRISPVLQPAAMVESDVMLDPWIEFPMPAGTFDVMATLGELPLTVPDIP